LTYNNLKDAPPLRKANESEMGFGTGTFASGAHFTGPAHGSRIKSIPANRSTGRGFAANRVYWMSSPTLSMPTISTSR
jgi:hypothetical protein